MFQANNFVQPGLYSITQKTVDTSDAALNYGGGALGNLLATPAYIDLSIKAAVEAVDSRLPEGLVTVGQSVHLVHHTPTCVGMTVVIKATIEKIEGNHIRFQIIASDNIGEIGHGYHDRVVVNRDYMLQTAYARAGQISSL